MQGSFEVSLRVSRTNQVYSMEIDPDTSFLELFEHLKEMIKFPIIQPLFEIVNLNNKVITDLNKQFVDLGLKSGLKVQINVIDWDEIKHIQQLRKKEYDAYQYDFQSTDKINQELILEKSEDFQQFQDSISLEQFLPPVIKQNGPIFNLQIFITSTQQSFLVNIFPQNTFRVLFEYIKEIANVTFKVPIFEIFNDISQENKLEKINIYNYEEYSQIQQKREVLNDSIYLNKFTHLKLNDDTYNIIIIFRQRQQSHQVTYLEVSRLTQFQVIFEIIESITKTLIESMEKVKIISQSNH